MTDEKSDKMILIVEDNLANFTLMARILEHMGLKCEWKTSGREVAKFAETLPRIDLILMDIRLPYEDGFHALRDLRKSEKVKDVPVIAVTAYASEDLLNRARAAGFDGFVGKPLDPDRFSDQVQRTLAGEQIWAIQ